MRLKMPLKPQQPKQLNNLTLQTAANVIKKALLGLFYMRFAYAGLH